MDSTDVQVRCLLISPFILSSVQNRNKDARIMHHKQMMHSTNLTPSRSFFSHPSSFININHPYQLWRLQWWLDIPCSDLSTDEHRTLRGLNSPAPIFSSIWFQLCQPFISWVAALLPELVFSEVKSYLQNKSRNDVLNLFIEVTIAFALVSHEHMLKYYIKCCRNFK